ncbi:MAG: hypothetical protein WA728_04995 [Xanthobacteraceae bacterium]
MNRDVPLLSLGPGAEGLSYASVLDGVSYGGQFAKVPDSLAATLRVTDISDAGSYRGSLGCGPLDPDGSQQTAHIEDQAVAAAAYH